MISYLSNITLKTANKIFDEYITILAKELSANNQLIEQEISKIIKLNLSIIDSEYAIHTLNNMKCTNNAYIELLSTFKNQYTSFANQHFHEIPYYSANKLDDTLREHMQKLVQNTSKQT